MTELEAWVAVRDMDGPLCRRVISTIPWEVGRTMLDRIQAYNGPWYRRRVFSTGYKWPVVGDRASQARRAFCNRMIRELS